DLKKIYQAPTKDMAILEFDNFKDKWQDRYPNIVKDWEKDIEYILAFYQYPYEIRRMLSTTNLIESVNSKIRKVADSKRVFPSDDALLKVAYGVILELEDKWIKPIKDWDIIRKQLEILYPGVIQ
ncbi:MAG: transposase, partial [Hydrogenobaculum sp.]